MSKEYLQQQLTAIDSNLQLVHTNVQTPYTTIDILAQKFSTPVAVKIKHGAYQANSAIGHIFQYARSMQEQQGEVYFVAPYIAPAVQEAFAEFPKIHLFTKSFEDLSKTPFSFQASSNEKSSNITLGNRIDAFLEKPLLRLAKKKLLG